MNVIAYSCLLYGKDYLQAAIKSIIDHVETYYVLYTPIGSHGHRTDVPCPESEDELHAIAAAAAGSKLRWHRGEWPYEGAQRDTIHQLAPDADVILVVDADELWPEQTVKEILSLPADGAPVNRLRLGMVHFWRSFYRAVLHDPALPERVIYPKATPVASGVYAITYLPPICHLGYAQRSDIVHYKQLVHGHKGEWRRDVDWFQDKFMANAQHDCHPVGSEYWQPEAVNPWDYLPEWMKSHPYASLDVIP